MSVFYTVISVCFFILWALSLIVDGDVRTDYFAAFIACDALAMTYRKES